MVRGNPHTDAHNPFQYDWHHLRVAGLGVAAVLCVLGFVILLSGKCKCRSKARSHQHVLRCPQVSPSVPKCSDTWRGDGQVYFGVKPPQNSPTNGENE
ncbi:FXYD domain-containing ion transport regulator 3-like [Myiozetetes cayanensis]|uniref:FXYD domain-containing ion transport regulator 3-like n=1 Tax=Myiozetetes cayanensis TaxID=478635 RepID=UPI00215E2DFB|nr:FXYD domain-containing ion transport regulator 3-like [Myiozetetes cayanensis]